RHVDAALSREATRLSDLVRRRARHAERHGPSPARPGTVEDVAGAELAWVSFVEVGERLLALRVVAGAVSVIELGEMQAARHEASLLRGVLAMHLNALGRGVSRDPEAVVRSAAIADALLMEPLDLPPGPVVVSPIAGLHDLPWGLLPSLSSRPFVIAPSVALWKRCALRPAGRHGRVTVAAGPSLALAAAEAERVASCHQWPTVLTGDEATVARVGAQLAGADVVHLVCHGQFSRENPMFSSLRMADGPMFVYDLERVAPPPAVVVLSACHAGSHATPTGREILGLTASLLATGPRSVIAGTVPIPDTLATVEVMTTLHTALAAGIGPADALHRARAVDPIVAGAFAAHGAH
ncbi:MAG: CHAT domain-containing protein, partial [Acidimicrobiia bacterium]|nr:CHAT domain-containing protein [Acidimicrobiia bacterium]